jgi:hypothetical protein
MMDFNMNARQRGFFSILISISSARKREEEER